jgi:hypothetical protein
VRHGKCGSGRMRRGRRGSGKDGKQSRVRQEVECHGSVSVDSVSAYKALNEVGLTRV